MNSNSLISRVAHVYFIAFLLLFFSGFYLTEYSGSSFSSLLRFYLLVGVFLLVALKVSSKLEWKYFLFNNKFFYIKALLFSFLLLFLCMILTSVFYGDLVVLRRAFVLMVFLFIVWIYSAYLDFNYTYLIYALGFFGFFVGFLYLYEYLTLSGFSFSGYRSNRVQSTGFSWLASYDNTITAALHVSFLCVAALWGLFNSKSKIVIAFFYLTFFILLAAIFVTFARTAWIAVSTSLLIFFIFEFKRNKLKVMAVYGVLAILAVLYLSLFYSSDFARGLTYRDTIWIGLLSNLQSAKDWMFGMGPAASVSIIKLPDGNFAIHAHNIYVETIYRNGLLGLILLLSLVFLVIRNLVLSINKKEAVFFIAIICGGSVAMFFDFSNLIYSPNLVWLWLWFPAAVSLSARQIVT